MLRIEAFGARKRSLFVSFGLSLTTDRCLPIGRSVFTLSAQLVTASSLAQRSSLLALCLYSPAIATATRDYRDSREQNHRHHYHNYDCRRTHFSHSLQQNNENQPLTDLTSDDIEDK